MRSELKNPEVAHRRRWLTLTVLCISLMVIGLDNTILNVALPTLSHAKNLGGLGASGSALQWIVDAYTLVFAGLLLTMGSLGDRFGRYKFLTFGLVVFGTGSVLSAFAPSAGVLIATRSLMGIGESPNPPAPMRARLIPAPPLQLLPVAPMPFIRHSLQCCCLEMKQSCSNLPMIAIFLPLRSTAPAPF